jgi:hypothetical protein
MILIHVIIYRDRLCILRNIANNTAIKAIADLSLIESNSSRHIIS